MREFAHAKAHLPDGRSAVPDFSQHHAGLIQDNGRYVCWLVQRGLLLSYREVLVLDEYGCIRFW